MNRYVRLIFDEALVAKQINGRQLTGRELQTYIEVYVAMFQAGKKSFPKAMTMLDATAEANNRNAYDLSLDAYKKGMDAIAGPDQGAVPCRAVLIYAVLRVLFRIHLFFIISFTIIAVFHLPFFIVNYAFVCSLPSLLLFFQV